MRPETPKAVRRVITTLTNGVTDRIASLCAAKMSGVNIDNGVFKIYASGEWVFQGPGDPQEKLPKLDSLGASLRIGKRTLESTTILVRL